jgi:pimeloyl-ACP methyl ester carboxylesterase
VKSINHNSKIILFGHSMGAYASCNVLNIQDVNKVIAVSPFENVQEVVADHVKNKIGKKIFLFLIIYRILLYFKFKSYSSFSTFKTLKNANTKVLVIQGEDDKTVLPDNFMNNMYYNQNAYINYILLENKHHFPLLSNDAMNYDLFLKHQITELKLKYNNKIPKSEIKQLNENVNYELKYKLDEGVLNVIKKFLREV